MRSAMAPTRSRSRPLLALAVVLGVLLTAAAPAIATTYTVSSSGDAGDVSTGDNVCDADSAAGVTECTLRAAIQQANAHSGADGIAFDGARTISPGSQLPLITDQVTIVGPVVAAAPTVELHGPGGPSP